MLGHQLRGWEKSHEPTGSQGPVPSCHEPEMSYNILSLSDTQSLPSITQPWQEEVAPATVKSSQAPCPAQSQNSCSAPQPPAVSPAPQRQWDRWAHVSRVPRKQVCSWHGVWWNPVWAQPGIPSPKMVSGGGCPAQDPCTTQPGSGRCALPPLTEERSPQ